jgi:hypothetical protein
VQARRYGRELRGFAGNARLPINRQTYRVRAVREDGGLDVAAVDSPHAGEVLALPREYASTEQRRTDENVTPFAAQVAETAVPDIGDSPPLPFPTNVAACQTPPIRHVSVLHGKGTGRSVGVGTPSMPTFIPDNWWGCGRARVTGEGTWPARSRSAGPYLNAKSETHAPNLSDPSGASEVCGP